MCGLVGVLGLITEREKRMFKMMWLLDVIRGEDSSGLLIVDREDNPTVVKEVGTPTDLWACDGNVNFNHKGLVKVFPKVLMGHNRAATIGEITKENAHPFEYGDIIGAHNGTLHMWKADLESEGIDVDSKALFNTIDKKGIAHTWKNMYGAAAITYWNTRTNRFHIIRNDLRPLCYAYSQNRKTLFYASKSWMIVESAKEYKIDLEVNEDKSPKIYTFTPNKHYTFNVEEFDVNLEETKDLERKYTQSKNTYMGFKALKKPINTDWSANTVKADKSFRGKVVKFLGTTQLYQYNKNTYEKFVTFRYEDGTILRAFPKDEDSYYHWFEMNGAEVEAKVLVRPRRCVSTGILKIDLSLVEEINSSPQMYKSYNGLVTKEVWWDKVNKLNPKGVCAACSDPLSIEDHKEILWVKEESPLCPSCAIDPHIMDCIYPNYYFH